MQEYKIIIILMLISAICGCGIFAGGNGPAAVKKVKVTDGEFLVYGYYQGGEITGIMNIVIRLKGNDRAVIYIDRTNTEENMPESYTNYHERIEVSLSGGSLIKSRSMRLDEIKKTKNKGQAGFEIDIDTNDMKAIFREYYWDGYTISTMNSHMPIKPGYSCWDPDSIVIGMRFLDMSKPGIAYSIIPRVVKDPIPISSKYYGDETVDVPAGKFKVGKYGYTIADPFIGKLIQGFHDVSQDFIYIEIGSRGLVIETKNPDGILKLEKAGTWRGNP